MPKSSAPEHIRVRFEVRDKTVLARWSALLVLGCAFTACRIDDPSGARIGSGGSSASAGESSGGESGATSGGADDAGASGASSATAGDAGEAGEGGSSGATAGKVPAAPSTGCGKANPRPGASSEPLLVAGHEYYVKLPTNYDENQPYPVLMMFNPTGNPISWAEDNAGFEVTGPKEAWIRVYPTMANNASGWGESDVAFFEPFYEQLVASFCVDKARVFAAGESSGGDFASILGCEHGDKIRATAPCATKDVPAYPLDIPTQRQCKGEVTAVVIHGKDDAVVLPINGPKTRDFYAALNHCSETTTSVTGYEGALSNCVMYQGCDTGYPVYWCSHSDPNYSGTNHGWPAFASEFLWTLFSSY